MSEKVLKDNTSIDRRFREELVGIIPTSTIAVVGLGYVGLPLAVQAAHKGYDVIGVDLNQRLIDMVNNHISPFANDDRFTEALKTIHPTKLHATTSFDGVEKADVVIICVPTPTEDNVPDLSFVINATKLIAKHLRSGQLVVLESTVNPGVTRDDILPILESTSKLKCGTDFFLAHCPERIDPGNSKYYVGNLNRVVGGITAECTKRAHAFYSSIIDGEVIDLASPEEAEFVKSWENSYRNVMIAMANEAAIICDALGMDINNVLRGLQSKVDQFGLKLAKPGIGPGGHCIPEDIHYVIKKARQNNVDTRLLDAATDLNDRMPLYAVGQLQKLMKQHGADLRNSRVVILGMAYKENIEDARRSPAIDVANILVQRAKQVRIHDPYVNMDKISIKGVEVEKSFEKCFLGADAVFIATGHDLYKSITPDFLNQYNVKFIFDGRNCLERDVFEGSGIAYQGIGR